VKALVAEVRALRPDLKVEPAFLELSKPDFHTVVDRLVKAGHDEIVVVPLLLTEAYHAKVDVPSAIAEASARHPQVQIHGTSILGLEPSFLEVLDERLREALRRFRAAYGRRAQIGPGEDVQAARAAAENALTPLAAASNRRVAARANDLLGLLAADDPSAGPPGGPSPLERALSAFRAAVRLDPQNEAARANLALALRLLEARGVRPGAGSGAGPRAGGRRGAGAGRPGEGY
jgi:hypothetical protein